MSWYIFSLLVLVQLFPNLQYCTCDTSNFGSFNYHRLMYGMTLPPHL